MESKDVIQRRWIASIVAGVIGVLGWSMVTALISLTMLFQGVTKSDFEFSLKAFFQLAIGMGGLYYLLWCGGAIPMFVVSTLGMYHESKVTGDSLIDHLWKNPKIKGG